jgi:hypothetical protein
MAIILINIRRENKEQDEVQESSGVGVVSCIEQITSHKRFVKIKAMIMYYILIFASFFFLPLFLFIFNLVLCVCVCVCLFYVYFKFDVCIQFI